MDEERNLEEVEPRFQFLCDAGFSYRYFYEKASDSACVYIRRFSMGRNFLDVRTVAGGKELNVVAFVNGGYVFPALKLRHKKTYRAFAFKHLFRSSTESERLDLTAEVLKTELSSGLFGLLKSENNQKK